MYITLVTVHEKRLGTNAYLMGRPKRTPQPIYCFIFNFISLGLVQGHSIVINLKDTQHIEAVSLTTTPHVVSLGGIDVEEADTSKYYKCAI